MSCLAQQLVRQRALDAVSKPHCDLPRIGGAVLQLLALLLILAQALPAQTTSGAISGRVIDPQGAAVAQAAVTALNQDQNTTDRTTAAAEGQFVFPNLLPGRYTITVEAQGFKTLKRLDLVLNANATVALGALQIEVGTQVQTVEVVAQGQEVQLDTAQRGESVIGDQLRDVEVNGQSPLFFTRLIPGVVSRRDLTESSSSYGNGAGGSNINGSRDTTLHVMVNGGQNEDTGANGSWMATVSLDSVSEVTVLTSTYQAQYGRSSGGQINVVTKSGTSAYHGSVFEYFRDRGMNANSWTNNRVGTPRAQYHYSDFGFTLGGPVTIPGKFNSNKNKLFLFWSEEWHHQLEPSSAHNITVPTAAERTGDFSASVNKNGSHITIKDPTTRAPIPGNIIPPTSLYAPAAAMFKLIPLPNAVDPLHPTYNYTSQAPIMHPRREDLARVDYNPTTKWRIYFHMIRNDDALFNPYDIWGRTNYPCPDTVYGVPGHHLVLNATFMISPTAVNELVVSQGNNDQYNGLKPGAYTRATTGMNFPTVFPPYEDYITGFTSFNGTQINSSAYFQTANRPFYNRNTVTEVTDNFSKTWNNHLLKAGLYFMNNWKVQPSGTDYSGSYDFGDNTSNAYDTGFGFANAALGVFNQYTQASAYLNGKPEYKQIEFYAQDSWKATPRLTLEIGFRFCYLGPVYNGAGALYNFAPSAFSAASAPTLLRPGFNASGTRVAVDPNTGLTYNSLFIGAYAPGTGNVQNGLQVIPQRQGITQSPGIVPAPRLGFAYDLTGRGKFVLRGGAGEFFDKIWTDPSMTLLGNPPLTQQVTINYGMASQLTNTLNITRAPALNMWSTTPKLPTTYQFNLGIESKLPKQVLLSVAYVGMIANHLFEDVNLNTIPFGAAFLPQNQDPTLQKSSPNALLGSNAVVSQLMEPYVGFGNITMRTFAGNSNYNSLQVSANRRFASGPIVGIAYTWSKCLDMGDAETAVRLDQYNHQAFYGPCGYDVQQNFVANYIYQLPKFASFLGGANNKVTRGILNDWQISGYTTFQTGTPFSAGMSVSGVSNINFTGTPTWGPKLLCVGDPYSGTSSTPYNRLNPAGFTLPAVGSIGLGCSKNNLRSPGLNDFDFSLQKAFPVREKLRLLLRAEAFNVFNHAQFTGINSSLSFSGLTNPTITNLPYNSSGQLTNITGFGTVSGVASPRTMQLVMKLEF
ncbi:MAG: carboxypeptidase regulatory-like domain-containing protein [Bryobacteraceae bacterium]|jgi:hypothetical protein